MTPACTGSCAFLFSCFSCFPVPSQTTSLPPVLTSPHTTISPCHSSLVAVHLSSAYRAMSFLTHIRANSRAALDFDGQSALRHRRRRGSKQVIIASCSLFLLVFLTGLYLAAPIDSTSILPFVTGHFRTTPSATDVLSPSAAVLRGHYNSTGKLDLQCTPPQSLLCRHLIPPDSSLSTS